MEAIKVNLIPNGIPETCHASQYDEGRQIRLDLFDGLTPYTIQAGDTFTLNVRKPDNHVITQTVTGTEGNSYLVIETSEQMTAVTGENLCEIRLENGGDNIGSLNFIMQVEKDVIANGIPSESVIEDLEALVVEAVGDNYYTKTETDELLAQKADVTDLLDLLPTDNASGAIANFTDGADDVPVKALSVEFAATQASGTPTPSTPIPIVGVDKVNVTSCGKNLFDPLKAVADSTGVTYTDGWINFKTNETNRIYYKNLNFGQVSISGVFKTEVSTNNVLQIIGYYSDGTSSYLVNTASTDTNEHSFVGSSNANKTLVEIRTGYTSSLNTSIKIQLEFGSTATDYEPFNGTTALINLGGTYYGGSVDAVTGKITKKWKKDDLTQLTWSRVSSGVESPYFTATLSSGYKYLANQGNFLCSHYEKKSIGATGSSEGIYLTNSNTVRIRDNNYTTASDFKNSLANVELVYELATPEIEYASNTAEIPTILGDNNFFSDAGDVDVTIRADIALYIQKMLGGNANRSLGANPSILRTGAISTDIEVREPLEPDSKPVKLEREITEQPENEGNDNEER